MAENKSCQLTPFGLLNVIQFFAAINENLYKLLAAFFLIGVLGEQNTNSIMAYVGAIFIIPFLLFSSLGGVFADKWPKNRIVVLTRFFELITLLAGVVLFALKIWLGAYIVLFFMASFSAIFGPSKYGLIPELVERPRLLWANSVIVAFTYLGIIFGTTLSSSITWMTGSHYVLALQASVTFAFLGLILSFFLPKTPVANISKPLRFFFYVEIWESIKNMWTIPNLLAAAFANAYFLFLGAYLQLNIIPYTVSILGMTDVIGGYFFLVTSLGLGIGAFLTDRISGEKIRLRFVPVSGIAISIIMILMYWFYTPWWLIVIWMFLLGFAGGTYLVPTQAYILAASPEEERGCNIATTNFFSFAFALLASFALGFFNTSLGLSPSASFFIIACLNILVMAFLVRRFYSE